MNFDRRQLLKTAASLAASMVLPAVPRLARAARVKKLLFVHGRGQQGLEPDRLRSEWLTTLTRGAETIHEEMPRDIAVAFPFYGDTLDRLTREFVLPLPSDIQARGGQLQDEFLVFQAEVAESMRQRAGVTDKQVDDEYGDDPQPRGPLNWKWVQAILRAIDKHGPGMSQRTLEAFTRDVFLYTTQEGVRQEIDRIVAGALTEEPTVVVAHSLGTVVAYHVLRHDPRALNVPLFVTVGSPLGVRSIRDKFRPLESPRTVRAWYNAFDPRDVVSLYPLDAANFGVDPAIENYARVQNHTDNRHGIVGYLDDADVAKRIVRALAVA